MYELLVRHTLTSYIYVRRSGIAICIAQTLGLHRGSRAPTIEAAQVQRSPCQNIWQCCIYRDVWLAFGMGRPHRIIAADSGSTLPKCANDLFTALMLDGEKLYSPEEEAGFAQSWESLTSVTYLLHGISTMDKPSPSHTHALESQISSSDISNATMLLTRVNRHLQLHQNAVSISLAQATGMSKIAEEAANRTTTIIQALMLDGTAKYTAPTLFSLLVPVMVMYLTKVKSDDPAERHLGTKMLGVYSEYLAGLEHNYPVASIVKEIFQAAQEGVLGTTYSQNQKDDRTQPSSINSNISGWSLDWLGHKSSSYSPETNDIFHLERS
jgi:hypothetical protein